MPILSTSFNDIGNAGQVPTLVRIDTDDSLSTVLSVGYLNILKDQNLPLSQDSIALVSTGVGSHKAVTALSMVYSNGNWSLSVMEGYQASGGGGGLPFVNVSGTTQAAVINTGYIIGNSSQTTVTLPASAPVGSIVAIQGKGSGGWVLQANGGQTIQVGQTASSSGGSVTSAAAFDAIQVVCVVANTTWTSSYVVSSGVTIA
jgi:hypothetical protein